MQVIMVSGGGRKCDSEKYKREINIKGRQQNEIFLLVCSVSS